jgi:hypothetical protein
MREFCEVTLTQMRRYQPSVMEEEGGVVMMSVDGVEGTRGLCKLE